MFPLYPPQAPSHHPHHHPHLQAITYTRQSRHSSLPTATTMGGAAAAAAPLLPALTESHPHPHHHQMHHRGSMVVELMGRRWRSLVHLFHQVTNTATTSPASLAMAAAAAVAASRATATSTNTGGGGRSRRRQVSFELMDTSGGGGGGGGKRSVSAAAVGGAKRRDHGEHERIASDEESAATTASTSLLVGASKMSSLQQQQQKRGGFGGEGRKGGAHHPRGVGQHRQQQQHHSRFRRPSAPAILLQDLRQLIPDYIRRYQSGLLISEESESGATTTTQLASEAPTTAGSQQQLLLLVNPAAATTQRGGSSGRVGSIGSGGHLHHLHSRHHLHGQPARQLRQQFPSTTGGCSSSSSLLPPAPSHPSAAAKHHRHKSPANLSLITQHQHPQQKTEQKKFATAAAQKEQSDQVDSIPSTSSTTGLLLSVEALAPHSSPPLPPTPHPKKLSSSYFSPSNATRAENYTSSSGGDDAHHHQHQRGHRFPSFPSFLLPTPAAASPAKKRLAKAKGDPKAPLLTASSTQPSRSLLLCPPLTSASSAACSAASLTTSASGTVHLSATPAPLLPPCSPLPLVELRAAAAQLPQPPPHYSQDHGEQSETEQPQHQLHLLLTNCTTTPTITTTTVTAEVVADSSLSVLEKEEKQPKRNFQLGPKPRSGNDFNSNNDNNHGGAVEEATYPTETSPPASASDLLIPYLPPSHSTSAAASLQPPPQPPIPPSPKKATVPTRESRSSRSSKRKSNNKASAAAAAAARDKETLYCISDGGGGSDNSSSPPQEATSLIRRHTITEMTVAAYGMVLCGSEEEHRYRGRIEKVKFGVPIAEAFSHDIPATLLVLLLKVNKEGPLKKDIWRAPGNQAQVRKLSNIMQHGRLVNISNISIYTAASVIKKFLSKLPGGIFGAENENLLFGISQLTDGDQQRQVFCRVVCSLPTPSQHLLVLLFGTFRIITDSAETFGTRMTPDAIGISVAPSLFHTCIHDGQKAKYEDVMRFKTASKVISTIIQSFGYTNLFPRECYEFYARITGRTLRVDEHWQFTFQFPSRTFSQPSIRYTSPSARGNGTPPGETTPIGASSSNRRRHIGADQPTTSRAAAAESAAEEEFAEDEDVYGESLPELGIARYIRRRSRGQSRSIDDPTQQRQRIVGSSLLGEMTRRGRGGGGGGGGGALSSGEEEEELGLGLGLTGRSPGSLLESTRSLTYLEWVHEKQIRRMKTRSEWFLSASSSSSSTSPNPAAAGAGISSSMLLLRPSWRFKRPGGGGGAGSSPGSGTSAGGGGGSSGGEDHHQHQQQQYQGHCGTHEGCPSPVARQQPPRTQLHYEEMLGSSAGASSPASSSSMMKCQSPTMPMGQCGNVATGRESGRGEEVTEVEEVDVKMASASPSVPSSAVESASEEGGEEADDELFEEGEPPMKGGPPPTSSQHLRYPFQLRQHHYSTASSASTVEEASAATPPASAGAVEGMGSRGDGGGAVSTKFSFVTQEAMAQRSGSVPHPLSTLEPVMCGGGESSAAVHAIMGGGGSSSATHRLSGSGSGGSGGSRASVDTTIAATGGGGKPPGRGNGSGSSGGSQQQPQIPTTTQHQPVGARSSGGVVRKRSWRTHYIRHPQHKSLEYESENVREEVPVTSHSTPLRHPSIVSRQSSNGAGSTSLMGQQLGNVLGSAGPSSSSTAHRKIALIRRKSSGSGAREARLKAKEKLQATRSQQIL